MYSGKWRITPEGRSWDISLSNLGCVTQYGAGFREEICSVLDALEKHTRKGVRHLCLRLFLTSNSGETVGCHSGGHLLIQASREIFDPLSASDSVGGFV